MRFVLRVMRVCCRTMPHVFQFVKPLPQSSPNSNLPDLHSITSRFPGYAAALAETLSKQRSNFDNVVE